jgi:hypothetical protein
MWAGGRRQRRRIEEAGLELASGDLLAATTGKGPLLEGISSVLLLSSENDFNELAAVTLPDSFEGEVYRVAHPRRDVEVVAPFTDESVLFGHPLTGAEIARRHHQGARIVTRPAADAGGDHGDLLFVIRADGRLAPVTVAGRPEPEPGDVRVLLEPAQDSSDTARAR